jgi:hypothetical protein
MAFFVAKRSITTIGVRIPVVVNFRAAQFDDRELRKVGQIVQKVLQPRNYVLGGRPDYNGFEGRGQNLLGRYAVHCAMIDAEECVLSYLQDPQA